MSPDRQVTWGRRHGRRRRRPCRCARRSRLRPLWLATKESLPVTQWRTESAASSPLTVYWVTAINVSRKWIEWAASLCTANSPFPGHVYCRHPVHFAPWPPEHRCFGRVSGNILEQRSNYEGVLDAVHCDATECELSFCLCGPYSCLMGPEGW